MRNFRDAKAMAHALRNGLKAKAVETTHSECLELLAKAFGCESWNVLSAKIEATQPPEPDRPAHDPRFKEVLSCSFCGKTQHEVKELIAGPSVFVCDECVGLCNDIIDDNEFSRLLEADEERGDRGDRRRHGQWRPPPARPAARVPRPSTPCRRAPVGCR